MSWMRSLALAALALALLPASVHADGSAFPEGPEQEISMVRGQPILLPPLTASREIDEVRVTIDGRAIQTDHFAPYEDLISTRRFDRLGFQLEVEHTITQEAFNFFDEEAIASASYPLVIHALPVIPRVHVYPMVVKKQTHLVGFQLRGIARGSRVMAWGHGFLGRRGRFEVPLRPRKIGDSSRTYVVPAGLQWRRHSHPHLIFSFGAPPGEVKYRFQPRGRIFTGVLRTKRNGDTAIRQTDGWKRCAWNLSEAGRPPRRASCFYLF
ncbi:MAG TPA: hypothetical protein VFS54_05980 [Solirubrobacterales bacterium]|nr:hypothetical protein [Solirubrobacterales bacterium]